MKKLFAFVLALVMLITAVPFGALVASAETTEPVLGDGNGDGKVTAADARIVLQIVAGKITPTEEQVLALNVNNDKGVTALDARKILRKVAGLEDYSIATNDILGKFGYKYDPKQDIYYTDVDSWQRYFGFTDIYDQAAPLTNMWYLTLKADFRYGDLLWRLQWWKGQYGILEGAEMGVYTKDPADTSTFYQCADNDHLIDMYFEYYRTVKDFNDDDMLFSREEKHWWLTGFKFGYTAGANKSVLKGTLVAYDDKMADGIEAGLKAVTDANGKWNGFVEQSTILSSILSVTLNGGYTAIESPL